MVYQSEWHLIAVAFTALPSNLIIGEMLLRKKCKTRNVTKVEAITYVNLHQGVKLGGKKCEMPTVMFSYVHTKPYLQKHYDARPRKICPDLII